MFSESQIQRTARDRLGGEPLPLILARQALVEGWVRLTRNIDFRVQENDDALDAYRAIKGKEFEHINARQRWALWRTIPRNLSGKLQANVPIHVIDLCCGVGHSTEALACYVPNGSTLVGIDASEEFIAQARSKKYLDGSGVAADVQFKTQSVLEPFAEPNTVDLINCSGAIGFHFSRSMTEQLSREIDRVLKPGGLVCLDSGKIGTTLEELREIFVGQLGYTDQGTARSFALDPLVQASFRKK